MKVDGDEFKKGIGQRKRPNTKRIVDVHPVGSKAETFLREKDHPRKQTRNNLNKQVNM